MNKNVVILIAEDDLGHASLLRKNLKRAGISNEIMHFIDGQQILDYLFTTVLTEKKSYILMLDMRMPKIDGTEVLSRIKKHDELKKIPVIVLTTTDDPKEIDVCHKLGCNTYIVKPIDYEQFINAIIQLGFFLTVVETPLLNS